MRADLNNKVVMFADLVGSTMLYDKLGDARAQRVVAQCLDVVKQCSAQHNGEAVAEIGDEVMIAFTSAADAAAAACEAHASMSEMDFDELEGARLALRIGVHSGPISGDIEDLADETAKISKWATTNAKPEQTLVTAAVIDALPRIYQAVSRFVDDETWNFISIEHMALHEIIWDVESVTAYSGEIPTLASQKAAYVKFSFDGSEVVLNEERPVISIGRGLENDLIVSHDMASRQHLSAQFSRGRCTITDNSTNGTVMIFAADESSHEIRRDSITLTGHGRIYLGKPDDIDDKFAVVYESS